MPANALETAGEVATLCQSCDEYVFVATNERGKVIGIFIGEEGDAPQATAYDEEGEDEEAGPVLGGRGFFLALLSILLGLVFLGWIASSLYCRPRPQTASTTAVPEDGTTVTPTPTPALPRPVVSIPAVIVLDSFSGVTFETDKATLTAESQQALQDLADTLKGAPPTAD
ncbi:MAG: hypothetical protein HYR56_10355 [Acidobacteria bacterium]|nr:hypothetical protein [Acidobacteriota bacterium]